MAFLNVVRRAGAVVVIDEREEITELLDEAVWLCERRESHDAIDRLFDTFADSLSIDYPPCLYEPILDAARSRAHAALESAVHTRNRASVGPRYSR
jgi:hypothetical protein